MDDLISRPEAIDALKEEEYPCESDYDEGYMAALDKAVWVLEKWLPSAQPFHNTTMNDVLEYIDGMPEDVWQEFTACLECRGWELRRRTAKWCGSEFA